jgi:hypothetical protein
MSLRTDYDLSSAISTAYQAGVDYIGTQASPGAAYADLSSGLSDAAATGKESFTITISVTHVPDTLKLENKYWDSFKAGIISALAAEGIYSYEVSLALNTEDSQDTKVDFTFSF